MIRSLIVIFVVGTSSTAYSQSLPYVSVDTLTSSIYRAKTGASGTLRWRECGSFIRGEEALSRAREYAQFLVEEYHRDGRFDPFMGAAIVAQESSFNRCATSLHREIRDYYRRRHNRGVRESDIVRVLESPGLRRRLGSFSIDAGLSQFRWPGVLSSNLDSPSDLLDAEQNISLLADSMISYLDVCDSVPRFTGTYQTRSGTTINYRLGCDKAYWVAHNTGGRWFNYRYYSNVKRWYQNLVR